MAAGLGTRMRSATPKHLHPLLGRRMVDWVLEAARALGASRSSSSPHPATADAFDGVAVAVQEEPLGTGDAVRQRAKRARRRATTCSCSPATRRSSRTALLDDLSRRIARRARRRRSSRSCPTTSGSYGRVLRDASGRARGDRRGGRRDTGAARGAGGELVDLRLPGRARSGRRSSGSTPHNAQGELYLTDAVAASRRRRASALRCTWRRRSRRRPRASTRASSSPPRRAALRDRINEAHMLAGVTIVDPRSTWIDADVALEPDAVDPSVHRRFAARRASRPGAEIGPHAVAIDADDRPRTRLVGPFCYLRPGTVLEARRRQARSWRSRTPSSVRATRCRISRTSATPTSARTRTSAPARSPPTSRITPGRPRSRTAIGRNVRTGVDTMFVAPVTVGDDAWTAAGIGRHRRCPCRTRSSCSRRGRSIKEGRGGKRDD